MFYEARLLFGGYCHDSTICYCRFWRLRARFCCRFVGSAGEEVLKLVPDLASGFLVINRPAAVDAKLQTLGREMQLPVPSLLMMLKEQFNIPERDG